MALMCALTVVFESTSSREASPGSAKQRKPAVAVGHADCGVTGSRQIARTVENASQHLLATPLGTGSADHVKQSASSRRGADASSLITAVLAPPLTAVWLRLIDPRNASVFRPQ
ncbi:MAG: hypothetical protein ACRDTH_28745 [Pseudonocardiaceae bacterium]